MLDYEKKQQGVTLIELLIAIAIVAILAGIAVPSFTTWLQNTQIRTATEAVKNGLQLARAEAIRRNEPVNFVLSSVTGTGWTVSTVAGVQIQQRFSSDGSPNVTATVTPSGATTVTYNRLGRISNTGALTQIDLDTASAQDQPLRIKISAGGQIRSCTPSITNTSDPRYCY